MHDRCAKNPASIAPHFASDMSDSGDYSEEETAVQEEAPMLEVAPSRSKAPATASSSSGSGVIVVVGIAAAVAVAGAVGLKLFLGRSKPGQSSGAASTSTSHAKKRVSPATKTVQRRSASESPRTTPAAAAAASDAPAASSAAPAAQASLPRRSAAPVLPKRPAPKPKPAAAAAAASAAQEGPGTAVSATAATAKAPAEAEAAKQAVALKAAEDKGAAQLKAAEEVAARERAAASATAKEKATKEKAAMEMAAADAVAKQKAAAAAAAATVPAAAEEQPAAAADGEVAGDGEAATSEAATDPSAEVPAAVHVLPQSSEIASLVVPLEASTEAKPEDEPAEVLERLADIPAPPLSFEGAAAEGELNEMEQKARQMSLHAHKLVKENNNIVQGSREQQAALDLLLAPESAGKARPHLVAACAFALGDMLLAQQKVEETKAALAIAYQASTHIEDKGPQVKALMNYAYILKAEKKRASARAAYEEALALAREQHGPLHGMVEKVKYELTAFLGGTQREAEAANMLIASAAELLGEAERLAAEEEAEEKKEGGETAEGEKMPALGASGSAGEANGTTAGTMPDPGTGLEHVEAETAAAGGEEEEEKLTPVQTAQHFAMRNLMNAAGVLDGLQQYERSEALLGKALDVAVAAWGTGSMQQLNVMYALAQHFRRRGQLQESIDFHEGVLAIMDESIRVYSPELLQNRISILRDTAILLDKTGQGEAAIDYATGALVNAQTLAGIMMGQQRSTNHPILEPFYRLLADLKQKIGDETGAAEAKRLANAARLNQRLAQANKQQQQRAQKGGTGNRRPGGTGAARPPSTGASTARAGGRRV